MKTYTVHSDAEAKTLHDGGISLLILPMEQQPSRSINDWSMDAEVGEVVMYRGRPHVLRESRGRNKRDAGELTPVAIRAPYAVDDVVGMKEAWEFRPMHGKRTQAGRECVALVGYRADSGTRVVDVPPSASLKVFRGWRASRTMPDWAIRTRFRVLTAEAKPVESITGAESIAAGINPSCGSWQDPCDLADNARDDFRQQWAVRYPQYPFETAWAWFCGIERTLT